MNVSSRTPEGFPSRCSLCGTRVNIEFSDPAGDAPCPNCGFLLWASAEFFESITKRYSDILDTSIEEMTADTQLKDLDLDSLELVELAMEWEEKFDVQIPDEDFDQIQTLGDILRYIKVKRLDTE